jgi:hypothetical protein
VYAVDALSEASEHKCFRCMNSRRILIDIYTLHDVISILNKALLDAASRGCLNDISYLLSQGVNDCNRALSKAAHKGHIKSVIYLISKGANDFNTAIINASTAGHLDIVMLLIPKMNTVLHNAVRGGNLEIVKYIANRDYQILNGSVSPSAYRHHILGPLGTVAHLGYIDIANFFVSEGAVLDHIMTPAINGNQLEFIKWAVSRGAHVNKSNISHADNFGYKEIAELLKSLNSH